MAEEGGLRFETIFGSLHDPAPVALVARKEIAFPIGGAHISGLRARFESRRAGDGIPEA
jgi:hypothetical protein